MARRGRDTGPKLLSGPGNLGQGLGITLEMGHAPVEIVASPPEVSDDGGTPARLAAPAAPARFLLAPPAPRDPAEPPIEVVTGPRVGVSGEGGSVRFPWRFSVAGHRSVSAFRRGRNVPD